MNLKDKIYQGVFHLASIFLIPVFIVSFGLTGNYFFLIPLVLLILFIGINFAKKSGK